MGSLEYAQARLSARFGQRPDEVSWRRIEHLRDLSGLLDAARFSAFGVWLTGVGPASSPHEIERVLRGHARALAAEVAGWMPDEWQSAIRWCATLADLPVVEHFARGGAVQPWMRDDAAWRTLCDLAAAERVVAPAIGAYAPLAAAWVEPARLHSLWRAEWRRRLPARSGADVALLGELVRVLHGHRAAFRDPAVRDGWPLRRALETRLVLLFRRTMLDPAAAFVFLALAALDVERLRGELVRRAAFPTLPLVA